MTTLLLLLLIVTPPAQAQSGCEPIPVVGSDVSCGDLYGSVSMDGDVLAVGASGDDDAGFDAGAVYVFRGIGNQWVEEQKIIPHEFDSETNFGFSLSVSGDTLLVGAATHSHTWVLSGGAWVYVYDGSNWVLQQELFPATPLPENYFGIQVVLDGDVAAVSSFHDITGGGDASGRVDMFRRNGTLWSHVQTLSAGSDSQPFARFGGRSALQGNEFFASSPVQASPSQRGVHVFQWNGVAWNLSQKLYILDGAIADGYGGAIAIRDDRLLIGASGHDIPMTDSGVVYAYLKTNGQWTQVQKILNPASAPGAEFGYSVAMGSHFAIVGEARGQTTLEPQSVYRYASQSGNWQFRGAIPSPAMDLGDRFGALFLAASGCTVAVGADGSQELCPNDPDGSAGKAYVYQSEGCIPCIPTLQSSGLIVLMVSLITLGVYLVRRGSGSNQFPQSKLAL